MNDLYAIDPEAITCVSQIRWIAEKFRPAEGRFIANFPNSWLKELRSNISDKNLDHTKLIELLKVWPSYMLQIDEKFSYGKPWIDNAMHVQKNKRIFEMILTTKRVESLSVFELVEVLESHIVLIKDSREDYIKPNALDYSKACDPLFQISEEIVLYDYRFSTRYLSYNGSKRDWHRLNVLVEMLKGMINYGKTKRFLIIFNKTAVAGIEDKIQEDLDEVCSRACNHSIDLRYDIDDGKFTAGSKHPRCIFSIKAGLKFDQGFQEFSTNEANLVEWMTDISLKPFREKFLKLFHSF